MTKRKATFNCFDKTGVLKVNTKVFVSFKVPSRRISGGGWCDGPG